MQHNTGVLLQRAKALLQKARGHHIIMGGPLEVLTARKRHEFIVVFCRPDIFWLTQIADPLVGQEMGLAMPAVPSVEQLSEIRSSKSA